MAAPNNGTTSLTKWQEPTEIKTTLWIMTNKALKIPLIHPRKSIYTAIVYNDLCIIMYLKQYDISLLHTHNTSHTCISTQIHTVHTITVHTHVDTHCSHIICIQLTMNHSAPHSVG